jgi:hypothetical protein
MRLSAVASLATAVLVSAASPRPAAAQAQPPPAQPPPAQPPPAPPAAPADPPPAQPPAAPPGGAAAPQQPGVRPPDPGEPQPPQPAPAPPKISPETRAGAPTAPAGAPPEVVTPPPAATPPPPPVPAEDHTGFSDKLVLDTGRIEPAPLDPSRIALDIHGEYQLRYRAMSDLRLEPTLTDASKTALGQNHYLYHWMRLTPRFQYRDKLAIVGQIDIPRGLILGDTTVAVEKVRDAMPVTKWYEIHPRYLYLEYRSPIGILRIGQQGGHWGMGILANDGDHPEMFGDYQRGSISERILFATTPMGKGTPLTIVLAGDLVFEDNTADLFGDDLEYDLNEDGEITSDEKGQGGDRAFQGVLAVLWRTKAAELGLYGVIRHQEHDREAVDELTPFVEGLTVGVIDATAKFNLPVRGSNAFVYGQLEAAMVVGSTTFVRSAYVTTVDPQEEREDEKIKSFGAAAKLGLVHVAGEGKDRWGDVVAEVEYGYATGDANPYDGTTRRFTFDPNHNVGLVLFDQVMAWKTARAATAAQDKDVVNRAAPGLQLLPSKGGVFGATYLNPRGIIRPKRWLDIKAGVVIAQTTADLVDPFQFGALGNAANYDGGDERRHDLGVELDLGVEGRIPLESSSVIQLGAEGGVLFPGHAFDDENGVGLDNHYLANIKVGLQF